VPLRDEAETNVLAYVDALGCKGASDPLACLRALPPSALLAPEAVEGKPPEPLPGSAEYQGTKVLWSFGPTVDGEVVPDMPRSLFAKGNIADVEYLLGTNTEEGALRHLGSVPAATEQEFLAALERAFGTDTAKELAALYPVADFAKPNDALIRVTTDWKYACAVQDFAERIAASGHTAFAYNFDHAWAGPQLRDALGKSHGAELNYVFGSLVEGMFDAEAKTLSELVQRYWTRFAASGDPNGSPDPVWPRFDATLGNRLNLNAEPSLVTHFREERCAFWKKYYDGLF
jgi:para-nitrobenzyl esterase